MHTLPDIAPLPDYMVERIEEVFGLYFRSVLLEHAGLVIPQHEHDHNHATYIGSGKARMWVDGAWVGDFEAGCVVPIEAKKKHVFQSLLPQTRLACVHDIESAKAVKRRGI